MAQRGSTVVKFVLSVFVFCSLSVLALHTAFSWVPKNVQELKGSQSSEEVEVVDLEKRLTKALEERYLVRISEEELNRYLSSRLNLTHSSIVDDYVEIKGVYAELLPGVIALTVEREIDYADNLQEDGSKRFSFLPVTQTVTLELLVASRTDEQGDVYTSVEIGSGYYGRAPAPGGLALLVKPSFDPIAEFFSREIALAFNSKTSLTVEDGGIVVDASLVQ